jgi:hypothetical protein
MFWFQFSLHPGYDEPRFQTFTMVQGPCESLEGESLQGGVACLSLSMSCADSIPIMFTKVLPHTSYSQSAHDSTITTFADRNSRNSKIVTRMRLYILDRIQDLHKIAFQADKLCGTQVLKLLYRNRMFRPETIMLQNNSLFMALSPEIRLAIYEFVFTPPYDKMNNILSILATCRKVHEEALIMALKTTRFHLDGYNGLKFQTRLRNLGDLQQHLRHIDVAMSIQKLDANSGNNPFVLTKLPLAPLEIDFMTIEKADGWLRENHVYHR